MTGAFPKLIQLKNPAALRARLAELSLDLPVDDTILAAADGSPLAAPMPCGPYRVGNRWCTHPMEGWDADPQGFPTDLTLRRWERMGRSGAKLIWGGEAAAVRPDGRANPHQLLATRDHRAGLARLLARVRDAHRAAHGTSDDLVVGLQLTHSGRFARPSSAGPAPRIAWHHPLLDARCGLAPHDSRPVWTDDELEELIDQFVASAGAARDAGFQFVDIKACHGYLLHEFLGAYRRPGPYGGDLAGRTRLLRTIIQRVRDSHPDLMIGVRLSAFDMVPFRQGRERGEPMPLDGCLPYEYGFGVCQSDPTQIDVREPLELVGQLRQLGVAAVNITAGSPYYTPHIQRPASFPPSDGYAPPEDPLVGVARLLHAARQCRTAAAGMLVVGTGFTYLQEYLPHVAQAVVRAGWVDSVGLGRMLLAYPELPADVLARGTLAHKRLCRTLSDCTTAPRHGLVSGCYPLDPFYKSLPDATTLKVLKQNKT
jgi:2,4-dienoyl-CoA reductase-like NADH-dependent reductase (Old Yellow Enzyme family)